MLYFKINVDIEIGSKQSQNSPNPESKSSFPQLLKQKLVTLSKRFFLIQLSKKAMAVLIGYLARSALIFMLSNPVFLELMSNIIKLIFVLLIMM